MLGRGGKAKHIVGVFRQGSIEERCIRVDGEKLEPGAIAFLEFGEASCCHSRMYMLCFAV